MGRIGRSAFWLGILLGLQAQVAVAHETEMPATAVATMIPSHNAAPVTPRQADTPDAVLQSDLRRQVVAFSSVEEPGTVIIDAQARVLYYVLPDDSAIRYGIGAPRQGFEWSGETTVARKAEWPMWTPPAEMIEREPAYAEYASGMPGGPDNPLGARALYLFSGGKDTLYRIHGTAEPWTIGQPVSSGCFRMLNAHVVELYDLVKTGAKVLVR